MLDTLSITRHVQGTIEKRSCESCGNWERQCTIQSNRLIQLEKQLIERDQQLARLGQDIQHLNTKYVSAIDRVADIQHEKDLVEHDLEDLSCKLFEQANDMVATEKREKRVLETRLQVVKQHLMDEQAQLKELRQRLLDWETDKQQRIHYQQQQPMKTRKQSRKKLTLLSKNSNDKRQLQYYSTLTTIQRKDSDRTLRYNDIYDDDDGDDDNSEDDTWEDAMDDLDDLQVRALHDLALFHSDLPQQKQQQQQSDNINNASHRYAITPMIDQMQLDAFQQFVLVAKTMPLKKLPQVAYVKHCQLEDVEPCLRFGPQSRLSTKKMINHLLHQSCFIQHLCLEPFDDLDSTVYTLPSSVAQRPLLWDRWNPSSSSTNTSSSCVVQCAACGRSCHDRAELNSFYQFKLDEKDTWLPMDQYCRDRLVAVCEFFVFIRNIHLQLYSHRTLDDLYSENIRLRLQMFYSRMGAMPVMVNVIGWNARAIGKACPALDHDDVSDGSLSNYCPTTPK